MVAARRVDLRQLTGVWLRVAMHIDVAGTECLRCPLFASDWARSSRFWVHGLALLVVSLAIVSSVGVTAAAGAQAAPAPRLALGAYAAGYPGRGSQIAQFESRLGSKVAIASSFRGWGDTFPDSVQRQDAATGHTLLIAWDLGATAATRFATFTSHVHDAYLAREAAAARSFGARFYVRPWPEMNGDWTPFQPRQGARRPAGGTYAQFIAAWRYVVTFFRSHGATNVRWVFDPTTDVYAGTTPITAIWPGRAYVDVLGLDGYNWGTGGIFRWRSFADVFSVQYRRLVALAPALPVWICEFGSKEPARNDGAPVDPRHSKANWYAAMFRFLRTNATHVHALVMFNVDKERDWRVSSDVATLHTVRTAARSGALTLS
jgi:mannan endo-1,4-beta-mannosidase